MDVLAAFLVTFVTPYILPSMGSNIGWIFGSVAAFSMAWAILFFPELKVSDQTFDRLSSILTESSTARWRKSTICLPQSCPLGDSKDTRRRVQSVCSLIWRRRWKCRPRRSSRMRQIHRRLSNVQSPLDCHRTRHSAALIA